MIKRCPVHGPARSRAVLVLLGGYDNSFQAEVVLAQESLVPCQILADDDGLGVGDESEAGDADRVFTGRNFFDSEPSFIVGYRPLLTLHGHHSREFHRRLGSLVHHRSRDGVGLGKRYGARQEQNQYQKKSPHGLLIDVQLSFPDDIAVILHHCLLPLLRVAWLGKSLRGAFVPF